MLSILTNRVAIIAILIAAAAAGFGGFKLGYSSGHGSAASECSTAKDKLNDRITELTTENTSLKLKIAEANKAIDVAKAQADAAEEARHQAALFAERIKESSEKRIAELESSTSKATTCGPVLQKYWELRQ